MAGSTAQGFTLFDTAIGRCGIAWSERGVAGTQLPEARNSETRARMRRRFPDAREAPPPPDVQRALDAIVALLGGGSSALVANLAWGFMRTGAAGDPPPAAVIVLAIVGALGAMVMQRYVIILGTSFGGAWTLIVGALALYAWRTDCPEHTAYPRWLEDVLNGEMAYGLKIDSRWTGRRISARTPSGPMRPNLPKRRCLPGERSCPPTFAGLHSINERP
jgi:hypothetical protein